MQRMPLKECRKGLQEFSAFAAFIKLTAACLKTPARSDDTEVVCIRGLPHGLQVYW